LKAKLSLDGEEVKLNPFVESLIVNINEAIVVTLKVEKPKWDKLELKITRE
jgi:hypothetical protein